MYVYLETLQGKERKITLQIIKIQFLSVSTIIKSKFCALFGLFSSSTAFSAPFLTGYFSDLICSIDLWPHLACIGFCGLKTRNDITGMCLFIIYIYSLLF